MRGVGELAARLLRGAVSALLHCAYGWLRASPAFSWVAHFLPKAQHPHLDAVEQVSPHTFRILGQNPGYHTLQGTNIYLVVSPRTKQAFIVDTGEGWSSPAAVPYLLELIRSVGVTRVQAILLSHGHADHQGGVEYILKALPEVFSGPPPPVYKRRVVGGDHPAAGFACEDIRDHQVFSLDGEIYLQALHTPGHTDDHVAFLFPEDSAVFTGDCVLGCGTSVFDDLGDYMRSLHILRACVEREGLQHVYPGHGPVLPGQALLKIDEYLQHRTEREAQVLQVLQQTDVCSSLELVALVYGALPKGVVLSAQANLLHHLRKLEGDGRVRRFFPDLWQLLGGSGVGGGADR